MANGDVVGSARIRIDLDSSGATAEVTRLGDDISSSLTSAVSGAASAVGDTIVAGLQAATVAAGALGAATLKAGADFNILSQAVTTSLTTILGTRDAARDLIDEVVDLNQTAALSRQVWLDATRQLAGFGVEADDIPGVLRGIEDAVLAAAGGGEEEFRRLTEIMAQAETQGGFTGDAIRSMGLLGINPAALAADHLGVSLEQAEDALKSGEITVADFSEILRTRYAGAVDDYAETWDGARGRISAAIRNIGAELTAPFIDPETGGAAIELFNAIADAINRIAGIDDGEVTGPLSALLPIAESAADAVSRLADRISSISENIPDDLFSGISGALEGLGPLIAAVGAGFGTAFAGTLPVIGRFLAGFNPIVVAIGALVAATPELRTAFLDVFQQIAEAVQPLLPVFAELASTLLGALAPVLGALAGVLGDVVAAIAPVITGLVDTLTPALGPLSDALVTVVEVLGGGLVTVIEALGPPLASLAETLLPAMAGLFGDLVAAAAPLVEVLAETAAQLIDALAPILPPIAELLAALAEVVGEVAGVISDALLEVLPILIETALGLLDAILPIVPVLLGLLEAILPLIDPLLMLAAEVLPLAAEQFTFIGQVITPVIEVLASLLITVIEVVTGVVEWITNLVTNWDSAWAGIRETVSGAIAAVVGFIAGGLERIGATVSQGIDGVVGFFTALPGRILGALAGFGSLLVSKGRDVIDGLKRGAEGAVGGVLDFFRGLPSQIFSAIGALGGLLFNVGKSIISGLLSGVQNALGGLLSEIRGIGGAILDTLAGALGIGSPSKVMAEQIGRPIAEGIAVGILSSEDQVLAAARKVVDDAAATMSRPIRASLVADASALGDPRMSGVAASPAAAGSSLAPSGGGAAVPALSGARRAPADDRNIVFNINEAGNADTTATKMLNRLRWSL